MFRCRNVSMHAFSRLFTTDLVANYCRVFDWLGAEYAIQNKLAVCLVSTLDWDNMAGIPQDICHIDSAEFSRFGRGKSSLVDCVCMYNYFVNTSGMYTAESLQLQPCMHACMHACMRTCVNACMHAYI